MGSNDHQTLKRLTPVVFLIATLFLVLGIFLSTIVPAQAQTSVPTSMATGTVSSTMAATSPASGVQSTAMPSPAATSAGAGTAAPTTAVGTSVPATVAAPATGAGTPTALVPVTGVDLAQVQAAAVAQQRVILDIGIVVVGLGLLVFGLLFRSRKG
jgi:hypothetical protein